jgi:TRAP-type mannitol/chloroaromatic compound transport system permease large subunit
MFEMSTYAVLMLVGFFAMLMIGIPVAISLAVTGFFFGWLGFGDVLFNLLPARFYGIVSGYQWMAIPLFVFMGVMLEKSRLADDLLDVMGHIAGGLKGGMAIGIVLFGVLMGATTGIVGATIITLGLLTLPTLIRRGYDKSVACGVICASGTLGQIIPPSLILILLSDIMQLSVGTLFAAAVGPGMLLAAVYIVYLVIMGWIKPETMPPIPIAERDAVSRRAGLHRGRYRCPHRSGQHGGGGRGDHHGTVGPIHVEDAERHRAGHQQDHRHHDVHPHDRSGVRAFVPRPAG